MRVLFAKCFASGPERCICIGGLTLGSSQVRALPPPELPTSLCGCPSSFTRDPHLPCLPLAPRLPSGATAGTPALWEVPSAAVLATPAVAVPVSTLLAGARCASSPGPGGRSGSDGSEKSSSF